MKTIGLLGGTGWSSTIMYYKLLNELVAQRLGGYHSAKILLKSIDYHDIMNNYYKNNEKIPQILHQELSHLIQLQPGCIMICCNSLHKYYDMIKEDLNSMIPVFHAVELTAKYVHEKNYNNVLLLATKFTMEDGFFTKTLEQNNIKVVLPKQEEQDRLHQIHQELMENIVTKKSKQYFSDLIKSYKNLDAVVLGCTEYPLVVDHSISDLPVIDPVYLQAISAVDYALT